MTNHTPGPWNAQGAAVISEEYDHICDTYLVGMGRGDALANARLIAAAPELLEACKAAYHTGSGPEQLGDLLRAVISKAETTDE